MKKYIAIGIIAVSTLVSHGQAWTNLASQLQPVFLAMSPDNQAATLAAWADYTRAVNRSPEFKGVLTNITTSITSETNSGNVTFMTNTVTTMTTNHPPLTFVQYYQNALMGEKVGRVVSQRNAELYVEMYRKVGQTVVDAWP